MRTTLALLATAAAIGMSGAVYGCGVCVEDKIAATYDHAVIRDAIAAHRQVIFVALDGNDATRIGQRIVSAAARVPGMQKASLRYAVSPPAMSFAVAKVVAPDKALAAFQKAVAGMDVRMRIVRIMRDGALVDPSG
ncbi:MAG TPA: hypothetical protein VKV24_18110 [Casimicrobiaceae bacterium]|nr:hypothetical protein [Casimicrobiaceae bacterium]